MEFIRHKDEANTKFKEWKAVVETQTGRKVMYLRSNNGGEYTSKEFESFCKEEGISRHLTTSYTFQQNGMAEKMNRTLLEKSRCM